MPSPSPRRSAAFLLVFAIANTGGVIGYLPLLSLLLPLKIEALAGEARIGLLTATVIAGAIAASLSNILFGWLSDRSVRQGKGRRRWMTAGLVLTAAAYAGVALAATPAAIVLAIAAFQAAVNALLAPMLAIMADEIPDDQKGVAGGLLALGNPVASAMSAALVGVAILGEGDRLACIAVAVAVCVAPLLLARPRPLAVTETERAADERVMLRRDLVIAWAARLLVQVAGNVLSLYLLYYFESVSDGASPLYRAAQVGNLMTVAFVVPLPIAVLLGRVSDQLQRRKPVLLAAALLAALGLLGMALAADWRTAAASFCLYAVGSAVFLALHSAFAMQLLPSPAHRGRDLGLMNLTNTLPALLGPMLAWALATPRNFTDLMLVLCALTLCGGLSMLAVKGRR